MKHLSRNDIEAISKRVIRAYRNLPEARDVPYLKVDPELLATKVLGLSIDYAHLSLDGKTLGLTTFEEMGVEVYDRTDAPFMYILDGKTILVESTLKDDITLRGRCNFSIMHESGHQILKMLYPKEYGVSSSGTRPIHFYKANSETKKPISDWEEWQANTLAAAILLPVEAVEQGLYFFGLTEGIDYLNKLYRPKEYEKFCYLADYLGASKKALAIRLKYLGYLKHDQLENPYEMIEVVRG